MTYDGSSKAKGLKLYLDGKEMKTNVETDNLYKDIIFHNYEDYIYSEPIEPGLQIGARWRGKGIGGATVDDIVVFEKELSALEVGQVSGSAQDWTWLQKNVAELSESERSDLKAYYLSMQSKAYRNALAELEEVRTTQADSIDPIKEIMVMKEMEKPRPAFILERGQYDVYGEEVSANTPEEIFEMTDKYPKNRLGLAQWLMDKKNPLTARVAVNRYWQNFFGKGIVETTEDFGNQGSLPSHPKLLDWLATTFMESNWDLKSLNKMIVMSNTYQQRSFATEQLREVDPENRLLARGPAQRLSGEALRDNALVASGLINRKIGGESVKPYQPPGLWRMNNAKYERDTGDKLYRRSLYTYWKRSSPNPTLATFDSPGREVCTTRRQETNTPLQALVMLNDPTFVEASRVLGEMMASQQTPEKGIAEAYLRLTGKKVSTSELTVLLNLFEAEKEKFTTNTKKADGWLTAGEYTLASNDNLPTVAAHAVVANTIMNSDATITKR